MWGGVEWSRLHEMRRNGVVEWGAWCGVECCVV